MVAVVVFGLDMLGIGGIARQGVEVDHAVELPALADPVVDRLSLGLLRLVVVAVEGRAVECILERRQSRAEDSQAMLVCARDQLLVAFNDVLSGRRRLALGNEDGVGPANVVDAIISTASPNFLPLSHRVMFSGGRSHTWSHTATKNAPQIQPRLEFSP